MSYGQLYNAPYQADADASSGGNSMAQLTPLLYKIGQAAEVTGLSRSLLYERIAVGELKVVRVGRAVRIPADELHRWIETLKEQA